MNAQDIRSKQKYFFMFSCLIFALLMSYASCQQPKEDDAATLNDSDYTDVDDIEWKNFATAETTTKGHPVIFYKEDIVSEDYDPNKDNKSSKEAKPQLRRRYKDINRRNRLNRTENYRYIKPEKVYFDVYPIEYDKVNEDDSKFNDDDIQVEVISLLDVPNNNAQEDDTYSKHQLNKRPKKVVRHHRQRRAASPRLPTGSRHLRKNEKYSYYVRFDFVPFYFSGLKFPVRTVNHNAPTPTPPSRKPTAPTTTKIENRFSDDNGSSTPWVVWGSKPLTERPRTRRPAPPVIHAGDEDYVPNNQQNRRTITTTPPPPTTITYRPMMTRRPTSRPSWGSSSNVPEAATALEVDPVPKGVKPCVWAVQSCCRRDMKIHYECFETLGCIGDFWDVNPCSEEFIKVANRDLNDYFSSK